MEHTDQERLGHDGIQLQIFRWRPDAIRDKLLLISHGLGEHARRYKHVAAYFTARGYEVVAFDHQGHGASGGKRGRIVSKESLVGETAAVLNAVDGPQYRHRVLWGHSMGGLLALSALRDASFAERLSAAVVTSPSVRTVNPPNALTRAAAGLLAKVTPNAVMPNGLDAQALSHDQRVVDAYLADPLNHDRLSFRLADAFLSLPDALLAPGGASDTPLLLMHGSADDICDVNGSRAYVDAHPGAPIVYREWPGLLHELHNEPNHPEVLDTANNFLNERLR